MTVRATVLCENAVYGNRGATAEHGWSVWLETPGGAYLFDTGAGQSILNNANVLGVDLRGAQAVMISHHHYDHTGGLLDAIRAIRRGAPREHIPVYTHPDLFKESYLESKGKLTFTGLPHTRPALEMEGAEFRLSTGWHEIAPGLSMTGEVPRVTSYELILQNMMHRGPSGDLAVDPIRDDQTVVIDTPDGLFVVLGCSHAGIINILTHIREQTGKSRFHTIIGGTHLGPVGEEQLERTIEALLGFDIGRLGVSHCTGPVVGTRLAREFGERFFFCSVGTVVEV